MNSIIYMGIGSLITLLTLAFIGFVDITYFNKSLQKLPKKEQFRLFVFYTCWEGIFFLGGVIIMWGIKC